MRRYQLNNYILINYLPIFQTGKFLDAFELRQATMSDLSELQPFCL
jgi:hypothetical protein